MKGNEKTIIAVVLLLAAALAAYFLFFRKSNAPATNTDPNSIAPPAGSAGYAQADKAMFQQMLQRFKAITGQDVPDWLITDMQKNIDNNRTLPAQYFYDTAGKPLLSGMLLATLESEWYGYGYNNKNDAADSKAKDDQWNNEFSLTLQQYHSQQITNQYK